MLTRVKGYAYAPLAVLALWLVALLAVSPGVAEAQRMDPTKDTQGANRAAVLADRGSDPNQTANDPPVTGDHEAARRVVVSPGDSLWSISEEWLGPDATVGQVANGVERIYALNRHRIGDPNLIFPGQELLVPPAQPGAVEPARGAAAERATKQVRKPAAKPRGAPARGVTSEKAPKPPRDSEARLVALPDPPRKVVTPEASSLVAEEVSPLSGVASARSAVAAIIARAVAVVGSLPGEVRYDERKLLGMACFAIAFGAAVGLVALAARQPRERQRARRRTRQQEYGRNGADFDPLAGLENQPIPTEGEPDPEQDTEGVGSEVARETRADAATAGARPRATGARELAPKGPTSKFTQPDGRKAGGAQGGR